MDGRRKGGSSDDGNAERDHGTHVVLEPKHKIFLSHSGAQKFFVEYLCIELERCLRYPFFDIREHSLPIGENFPRHIFNAIRQCHVGVVILSREFLTSKWPMMELVAMVEEAKSRDNFKLIPIFLHISPEELSNIENVEEWRGDWKDLAMKNPERIEVEKWEAAAKYLRSLNGLVKGGSREYEFLRLIVDHVCAIVPAELKLEDSNIQGKSRLCKVIWDKIDLQVENKNDGVYIVGLHGMGGMGKTTICKALCNEFYTKFYGRVYHAELERVTKEELLRDVLKRLSNTSQEHLNGFNLSELYNGLREGKFIKDDPIFLALGNMSDSNASIMEAKGYLSIRFPPGSIVMVTTRYKEALVHLRPYIDESACIKMPELEEEEARSLFVKSSDGRNEDDEELIQRCLKRCRFSKDDGKTSYDYHPLALDVLGRELAKFDDPNEWRAQLDMIDVDIFNLSKEKDYHPIFSILRKSFDTLIEEDQVLFMDIVLLSPLKVVSMEGNIFEWLGMVHKLCVEDVVKGLERLRKKSLLESYGDGASKRSICMHDLWYEFCIVETKFGELKKRRWVYETKTCNENSLCETSPSGNCWENVKRMIFLKFTSRSLERVNFAHFPNVRVLTIGMDDLEEKLMVDLSGLIHLRSLVIVGSGISIQGLPRNLVFLRMEFAGDHESISQEHIREQIGAMEELHYLQLTNFSSGKLPDTRNMISLREAIFNHCSKVVMDNGLSLNLRVLRFSSCIGLQSCPSIGDLVLLEELDLDGCWKLENLPYLGRLRKLRELKVVDCGLITELSGLGDLVALEQLSVFSCIGLLKLPDMRKLTNLRVLDLLDCSSITEVPGLEGLTSLQALRADFRAVVDKPNLRLLTKLQEMSINGWSSREIQELSNSTMLKLLDISFCSGVDEMPDFNNLSRLQYLAIWDCEFKDVSSLSTLSSLQTLSIHRCNRLERLPDFQRLPSLLVLMVEDCVGLRGWDCTSAQDVEGRSCRLEDSSLTVDVPNAEMVMNLVRLVLENCGLANLTSIRIWSQLGELEIAYLPVTELPDLSSFPRLKTLCLRECENLVQLTSREPLTALSRLEIHGCSSLATLPDICSYFAGLLDLKLKKCDGIVVSALSNSTKPLMTLKNLEVELCNTWTVVPDLEMFPSLRGLCLNGWSELHGLSSATGLTQLEILNSKVPTLPDLSNFSGLEALTLRNCEGITSISCTGPLTTLTTLALKCCNSLRAVPDLEMFPSLESVNLSGCSELVELSCSVPLTGLRWLNVRRCRSLSRADLKKLRALCSPIKIFQWDEDDRHEDQIAKRSWRVPLLGLCAAIVVTGILSFTRNRSTK